MRPGVALRTVLTLALAGSLGSGCAAGRNAGPKPAWELPPPPPIEAPVVKPGRLHRAELDNGLRILVLEDRRLPTVVMGVTFRRGEAAVPVEQAGLASFTADLLGRGAGERDALAFAESIDRLGASVSASAGWDTLSVSASGLSRDFDFLLDTLADVVLRPRFDEAEADRARSERLAALESAKDDPATLAVWYAAKALYGEHRFGLPASGSPETVARLDVAAARAFHERVLIPNDAIFAVSGDVVAADVVERLAQSFGAWTPHEISDPGPPPPAPAPPARKILIVDRPDLVQARIVVGHEGIARTADDRTAVQLMNSVLGGSGFSSRLMDSLRTQTGLTYSVYSAFSMKRGGGSFVVSTFTRVPEVRRALDLLLAELERGRAEPPGEEELTWARTLSVGRFSLALETSAAVADGLTDLDVYGLPPDALDTYRSRVRGTTVEEIAAAARSHLHPDRAAIVLVGPAADLEPQVADLGPIEIVTP